MKAYDDAGMKASACPDLRERARGVMRSHWVDIPPGGGYTAPNPRTYPWQWLWDSCFHSLIWAELGDDRGVDELSHALGASYRSGCVPHMRYELNPRRHEGLWGRRGASSLAGPPMFGHAIADLMRRGVHVPERLVSAAADGLRFLLERRPRCEASGLLMLCHPWESGADDDPRWDGFCPGGYSAERWKAHKNELVRSIERDAHGAPLFNPRFKAASAGFSALTAFNALELAEAAPGALEPDAALRLGAAVRRRWDVERVVYADSGGAEGRSGRVRTAYGLLPLLVESDERRLRRLAGELLDAEAFGGRCGPSGVHKAEPAFSAGGYWRGPSWPPLNYLLWLGMRRSGLEEASAKLAAASQAGAAASGLAECWDSDDGTAAGAVPQSWAGLALLMF